MKFQFDSLEAFIAMNGHGPFVWAAYAITLSVVGFLIVHPILQKRKFLKEHHQWQQSHNSSESN